MATSPKGERVISPGGPIRFGKYTLLARLASGGMGEVYVAQMGGAAGFEKQVVIKRILPQLARDEQFVDMFLDEARITAQLNHPNICQVFDLGEIDGEYFIAMEYLAGLPLSRVVEKHGHGDLDLRIAAGIVVQACEGLAYAHDFADPARRIEGIVHRDVSPQNLFVTAPGLVKVLDFGVAKLYREGSQTVTVSTKGKHLYMAPEQVQGDRIDQRADIFALATVMFETLTGRSLFGRATQYLTLEAIVTGDRPSLLEYRPDAPAAMSAVFDRALALAPDDRFPSARAMAQALSDAIAPMGGPASIPELAQFVQYEYSQELQAERELIQRAAVLVSTGEFESRPSLGAFDGSSSPEHAVRRSSASMQAVRPSGEMPAMGPGLWVRAEQEHSGYVPVLTPPSTGVSRQHIVPSLAPEPRRWPRWLIIAVLTLGVLAWFGREALFSDKPLSGLSAGAEQEPVVPSVPITVPDDGEGGERVAAGAGDEAASGDGEQLAASGEGEDEGGEDGAEMAAGESGEGGEGGESGESGEGGEVAAAGDGEGDESEGASAANMRRARARAAAEARARANARRRERRDTGGDQAAAENGYFTIDARPYATIFIDGKKRGLTPLTKIPLSPGRHRVRAVAAGGQSQSFTIQVTSSETLRKKITFDSE